MRCLLLLLLLSSPALSCMPGNLNAPIYGVPTANAPEGGEESSAGGETPTGETGVPAGARGTSEDVGGETMGMGSELR